MIKLPYARTMLDIREANDHHGSWEETTARLYQWLYSRNVRRKADEEGRQYLHFENENDVFEFKMTFL